MGIIKCTAPKQSCSIYKDVKPGAEVKEPPGSNKFCGIKISPVYNKKLPLLKFYAIRHTGAYHSQIIEARCKAMHVNRDCIQYPFLHL